MVPNRIGRVYQFDSRPLRVAFARRMNTREYQPTLSSHRRLRAVLYRKVRAGHAMYFPPYIYQMSGRYVWKVLA